MRDIVEYEVLCDDLPVASCYGPIERAAAEALRYAALYAADGPVRLNQITRRPVTVEELKAWAA